MTVGLSYRRLSKGEASRYRAYTHWYHKWIPGDPGTSAFDSGKPQIGILSPEREVTVKWG